MASDSPTAPSRPSLAPTRHRAARTTRPRISTSRPSSAARASTTDHFAPGPDPAVIETFTRARQAALDRIGAACVRSGRDAAGVELIAVSKTVAAERLVAAVAAGLTLLGENRVQEAEGKAPGVPGATWVLVGPLQGNKARRALEVFARIDSVDSVELARRLDRLAAEVRPDQPLPVHLQVNVDADPRKAGFNPDALPVALGELAALPHLRTVGLMTVGRLVAHAEEARPTFVGLRELSERLRREAPGLGPGLSMGMSDDFEVAVEEGATSVRVGRAIFGERPPG
jgi:pyridoxal phosphate enzyme (YggS family)